MADLKKLQRKLDGSKEMREKFLKDPVAAIKAEGIELSKAEEAQVTRAFSEQLSGTSKDANAKWEVGGSFKVGGGGNKLTR